MDKNKLKLIKFFAMMATPFILSIGFAVLRIAKCHWIPWWVILSPIWIPMLIVVVILLFSFFLWKRYHWRHSRKCCGTCVHCMDDVYCEGPSKCLYDGSVIKRPARHSCSKFFGSALKDYEPKE